ILDFETDYPGTRVVRLEQNYRSTKRILALASGVIAHNVSRKDKALWTENDEGERAAVYRAWDEHEEANFVAQTILAARNAGAAWSPGQAPAGARGVRRADLASRGRTGEGAAARLHRPGPRRERVS